MKNKKMRKSLCGQLVQSCPEHVVLRDGQGEFELSGPCNQPDCVSTACRKAAAKAAQLAEIREVADIFGPEVRMTRPLDERLTRRERADVLVIGTPLALACPEASAFMDNFGFIRVVDEECGRVDCTSPACRARHESATGSLETMARLEDEDRAGLNALFAELGLLREQAEVKAGIATAKEGKAKAG
ncbi:MAG: hypothetical protein ACOYUZ_01515 [Patescibacteria group bacterium]